MKRRPKVDRLVIVIDLPPGLDKAEHQRLCDATLLRMVSASVERRPVDPFFNVSTLVVHVSRPPLRNGKECVFCGHVAPKPRVRA